MRVIVTSEFLHSARELSKKHGREVLDALRRLADSPGDAGLQRERFAGADDNIQSIRAGDSCRILFSGEGDVKLLFAGADGAAHRFAEHGQAAATAFAEAPIAFQLHIDFWQTDPLAAWESPSCGAAVSVADLGLLILHGRKYLPLAHLLLSRGPEAGSVELSFREIETALAEALPKSARTLPVWWANDRSHVQANAWLAIGWQAAAPNLQRETITFVRSSLPGIA